jgi:exodeoxyribonuclease VII small subunit
MKENVKKEEISFETALNDLESIVRKLESGTGDLDKAIADYEKGSELIKLCEKKLNAAKLKVEKIVKGQGGEIKTEEFEV